MMDRLLTPEDGGNSEGARRSSAGSPKPPGRSSAAREMQSQGIRSRRGGAMATKHVIETRRPDRVLRPAPRDRGPQPERGARGGVRFPRAERRGQDDHAARSAGRHPADERTGNHLWPGLPRRTGGRSAGKVGYMPGELSLPGHLTAQRFFEVILAGCAAVRTLPTGASCASVWSWIRAAASGSSRAATSRRSGWSPR
jgi:hypothetical protein